MHQKTLKETTRNALNRREKSENHGMEDEQGCRSHDNCETEKSTDPRVLMVGLLAQPDKARRTRRRRRAATLEDTTNHEN